MRRYQNKIPVKGTEYFIEYSWDCNEYLILRENNDTNWIIETVVQSLNEALSWIRSVNNE